MAKNYYSRSTCRLCGSAELEIAVPLGLSPITEKFLDGDNVDEPTVKVPLDLYFCRECSHVQLINVVEKDLLWSDYTFRTSDNPALIEHFDDYVERVLNVAKLKSGDLVIDVGSNDGTLLRSFQRKGYLTTLGIDPAQEIALEATQKGVRTIVGFMDVNLAVQVRRDHGLAKLVTANNVYAHSDDLSGMTNAIKEVLDPGGLFVFEVSYLLDVIEKNLIGTIFHEHLSYHSLLPLKRFLDSHKLEVIHVERGPEQGGSIVVYVQWKGGGYQVGKSVQNLLDLEFNNGLSDLKTIVAMSKRLNLIKRDVRNLVETIVHDGHTVAGFGAARAGTTLLSYFDVGSNLEFLVDDNSQKQFRFSPGDKLKVLPTDELYKSKPDFVIILAWIHADKILEQHKQYMSAGGRFIRLFPEVKVYSG